MTQTAHESSARIAGILESTTELRLPTATARDWAVRWINDQLARQTHAHIREIEASPTRAPNILELRLAITGHSFEEAEKITDTFLDSLEKLIGERATNEDRSDAIVSRLSMGLTPA